MNLSVTNDKFKNVPTEQQLVDIAKLVLKTAGQPSRGINVGLHIVGSEEIAKLNKEFRKKNAPTDVLSFRSLGVWKDKKINRKNYYLDYDEATKTIGIGDIFICIDVAKKQAKEYKHSLAREVAELFVHGLLHLIGHDHHEENEAQEMKELEEQISTKLDKFSF